VASPATLCRACKRKKKTVVFSRQVGPTYRYHTVSSPRAGLQWTGEMGRVDGLRPVNSSPLFFSVSIPFSFSDFLVFYNILTSMKLPYGHAKALMDSK
jgi:hypothetical protein